MVGEGEGGTGWSGPVGLPAEEEGGEEVDRGGDTGIGQGGGASEGGGVG